MREKVLSRREIESGIKKDSLFKVPLGKILEDKAAIITGCSSGLGAATTRTFLDAGAKVVGCYYNKAYSRLNPYGIADIDDFTEKNNYQCDILRPLKVFCCSKKSACERRTASLVI